MGLLEADTDWEGLLEEEVTWEGDAEVGEPTAGQSCWKQKPFS